MLTTFRPRFMPPPYQDSAESGRLILRDGTTATVRPAHREDAESLGAFFRRLSDESRWHRFFSTAAPRADSLAALCDSSNPRETLTLLVHHSVDGKPQIIATGSYLAMEPGKAEVAFAVEDSYQGKGLGTLLLERLALLAIRYGITRFWAVTHTNNRGMLDVFRRSGFSVAEKPDGEVVEVDLSVIPSAASVEQLELRDRVATAASLRPFFAPKAVAVVGASRDPSSIGFRILEGLVHNRFQGPVYPINPKASVIGCIRAYPSVRDVPEPVDLAVIAVPAGAVMGVVDDCAARGVRALVVITAGFAEVNEEGRQLQKKLVDKVRGYGMRMVGPNCMGLLNADPAVSMQASFAPVFPPAGRVAMSSQSGALGLALLAAARRFGLGLSTFVSVGNKADVSGNDLLQYWEEDPGTDVILLYLESFGNPRRFARIARRVSRRKPIVALKSGRTQAGGRAAGSHTAALAAKEVAVDALFRLTGVIRAETLEEMFDLAAALGSQPLPAGKRVGIVTNAGGPAILCTDACEAAGLNVPELTKAVRARLSAFLPASAGLGNPIDMIASASPEQFGKVVETLLTSGEIDSLVVIYIPVGLAATDAIMRAVADGVVRARAAGATGRTVLTCLMSEQGVRTQIEAGKERIPCFAFPEAPGRVLGKVAAYADWRAQPEGVFPDFEDMDLAAARAICKRAKGWLSSEDTREVLSAARLPISAGGVARTPEQAVELATRAGFPVAVKLASRILTHKTEVGGVRLNVRDAGAVRDAFLEIRERLRKVAQPDAMDGVLVQPMVSGGVEVMVGVTQDPLFGPLVAFGLGGILVEVLSDVCFRVAPLTDRDAAEMPRSIRGIQLLQGHRGKPPADLDAIEELLLRVSRLVEEVPEINEIDFNPVIALPPGEGCRIVDARIHVKA
jgi:acetyl coenzyme A synthetase (ADP forming)-like protein